MRRSDFLVITLSLTLALTVSCRADEIPATQAEPSWVGAVGAGAIYLPRYDGAKTYRVLPMPYFDVAFGDFFASVERGIGWTAFDEAGLSLGAEVKFKLGRSEKDDPKELQGLKGIKTAVEPGAFMRYDMGPLALSADVRSNYAGGNNGFVSDMSMLYRQALASDAIRIAIGPTLQLASKKYEQTYLGINDGTSFSTKNATYDPHDDLEDAGGLISLSYCFSDHLALVAIGRFSRFLGNAANSPIVKANDAPNQWMGGLLLTYSL